MAQINFTNAFPSYLKSLFNLHLSFVAIIGILIGFAISLVVGWLYLLYLKLLDAHGQKYTLLEIKPTDKTLKSPLATTQLYTVLHSLVKGEWGFFYTTHRSISLEIASTKEGGIRFILRVPQKEAGIVTRNIYSYLPGVEINKIDDYFSLRLFDIDSFDHLAVQEMKLTNSFLVPLEDQDSLGQVDPIAYITGHMTQLLENELVVAEFIATPIHESTHAKIAGIISETRKRLDDNLDISDLIKKTKYSSTFRFLNFLINTVIVDKGGSLAGHILNSCLSLFFGINESKSHANAHSQKPKYKSISELGTHKQKQFQDVHKKITQPLFNTTIRFVIYSPYKETIKDRLSGMTAAYETVKSENQSLKKGTYFQPYLDIKPLNKFYLTLLKDRLPLISNSVVLSASELSSLFHLPYTTTTKTEDISKNYYKELPAPLSLKQNAELDIVFAKNTYGGITTPIGVTKLERTGHFFVIGQTRSGKTNMIKKMIIQDIQKGRGVVVIDPHGDLAKELIPYIPESRINDFMYFNPRDIKHPMGINLLELSHIDDEDEKELEKDIVSESAISILRKVFSDQKGAANAFKIESILRNTIHTAFLTKDPTLFTIFDLLNNPEFRSQALQKITDPRLMDFWREEFGNSGDWQRVKMVAPVNARVGRFLFSPIMKRILEQKKSTINFDDLLNNEKILIAGLSKGEIGEDNCVVLGTLIITKIRQAAEKRAFMDPKDRKPLYLYVDEFQNFATPSFIKMLSELGKFGINIIIVEQSTSQQPERTQTHTILANTGNVITFKTANPIDEDLMLAQFSEVERGHIPNLPRYHFYMKKGAVEPEAPFSGVTDPVEIIEDKEKVERFIQASRKNYAIEYKKQEPAPVVTPQTPTTNNNNHKPYTTKDHPPKKQPKEGKNPMVKPAKYLS